MLWLEITGRCQLECVHCYADSGPHGGHGSMTLPDWERIIDESADLGVDMVQFIGGEPTLYPDLPGLIDRALGRGLEVEVFTNLVHVGPALWETFTQPGVSLATSWYSDDPSEHATITRRHTHERTRANLAEAVRRSIPLRIGIIAMNDEQRTPEAHQMLTDLGVTDVGIDRLRQVGRGVRDRTAGVDELCGNCGDGVLAVGPDGSVWPCVFSRWLPLGNVHDRPLLEIMEAPAAVAAISELRDAFAVREMPCLPKTCDPQCGPKCSPEPPGKGCPPIPKCVPRYHCGPCHPDDRTCAPENNCKPNKCRPTK
ncbi:MAG: radical SAM protein [Pseudonocardia sp.]|nr:radical SAM protein [Pseudonocardia sp.]